MKWTKYFILIFFLSCNYHNSETKLSFSQSGLNNLANKYKADYLQAGNSIARDEVKNKYQTILEDFIRHNCNYVMDSMRVQFLGVQVDTNGRLTANFKDSNCFYKYHEVFKDYADMKQRFSYRLLSGLQENKDTSLTLLYDGVCKVNDLTGDTIKPFDINIIPSTHGVKDE